jgi:putative DNA primase/helicase
VSTDNLTAAQERFLAHFDGAKREGDHWKARCPGHDDHSQSLSIKFDGSRALVHDFAGCGTEYLLERVGLKLANLYFDGPTNSDRNQGRQSTSQPITKYPYVDETGKLLFEVLRFEPKDFRQRKPEADGGWSWHLNGVRRVLYQLPDVLSASDTLITEGEKDCESARRLGFVATCNPGGAGKWKDEYSEFLRGKNVSIIPDNDEPGRKHAQQVAVSLHLRANSVKVLELPGAKDLTEWIERGGTREQLLSLIQSAAVWAEKEKAHNGFQLTSLRDLMLEPEENISFLLADKLPAGGLSILSAKPKVGKSTLARGLCLAVARGEPFLGCATSQGSVIYLALEEKRSEVRRHFQDLGATGEEPIHVHVASAPRDAVQELCGLVKKVMPVLLVIDPLFKLVRVRDEKAYAEVCAAIEPLLNLARESGAHVLATHHNGKMERADAMDAILGSTAIFGGVDSAIILKKSDRYRTVQSSQRYGVNWPELVLNFDPEERSLSLGVEKSEAETGRIGEAIAAYLAGCDEPQTRMQIEEHVEGRTTDLRKALKELRAAGQLSESGTGTKGDPFRFGLESSQSPPAEHASKKILVPKPLLEPERVIEPREQESSAHRDCAGCYVVDEETGAKIHPPKPGTHTDGEENQ